MLKLFTSDLWYFVTHVCIALYICIFRRAYTLNLFELKQKKTAFLFFSYKYNEKQCTHKLFDNIFHTQSDTIITIVPKCLYFCPSIAFHSFWSDSGFLRFVSAPLAGTAR